MAVSPIALVAISHLTGRLSKPQGDAITTKVSIACIGVAAKSIFLELLSAVYPI